MITFVRIIVNIIIIIYYKNINTQLDQSNIFFNTAWWLKLLENSSWNHQKLMARKGTFFLVFTRP